MRGEGDGVGDSAVRGAIVEPGATGFWEKPETAAAILARMPEYRLSKFQDALPEAFASEMFGGYLLDTAGAARFLGGRGGGVAA